MFSQLIILILHIRQKALVNFNKLAIEFYSFF